MHINDYVEELQNDVKRFHEHWMNSRKEMQESLSEGEDPDAMWPLEMGGGEWFYQFMAFMSMEHEVDYGD